jgi:hypothetical protein
MSPKPVQPQEVSKTADPSQFPKEKEDSRDALFLDDVSANLEAPVPSILPEAPCSMIEPSYEVNYNSLERKSIEEHGQEICGVIEINCDKSVWLLKSPGIQKSSENSENSESSGLLNDC